MSLDPQNNRTPGNLYAHRKEEVFRRLWLPAVQPEAPKETFLTTQLSILKDIYPNIWQYGPRGDVYNTQIQRLKTLLDNHVSEPSTSPLRLPHDVEVFNNAFDIAKYTHRSDITRMVKNEQRPDSTFHFLSDRNRYPIYTHIARHVAFGGPVEQLSTAVFLTNFTYHSLYRDLILRYPANEGIALKWVSYMHAWGMPA